MKFDIITLFPSMFDGFVNESIIKRAINNKLVEINVHNLRDYSPYKNGQVDDYQFGGGPGMVLMCEPVFNAVESLRKDNTKVIMLTPSGEVFTQKIAKSLSNLEHIILLCGHYEGFDERIKTIVDMELSIGDYVLTGGEIPSMVICDSITRLIPGVINIDSLNTESFNDGLLDYPVYTRPEVFRNMSVPQVLLSGHHANIDKYRSEERIRVTKEKRIDLLEGDIDE